MRIVFMGTPAFAVPTLKALYEDGHDIAAVYTQPPRPAGRGQKDTLSPVHDYAFAHDLPVFTPEILKSPETQNVFAAHKADVAIVVAYGLLLPKPILTAFPFGCINVHPSLLPRWRGATPIQRAIMAGDKETGITIMQMDKGLDTGDMLLVERYPLPVSMNSGALHDMLSKKAGPLVLRTLEGLQRKNIAPVKQPNVEVEYAKKITKDDGRIEWNHPAQAIYRKILGLSPTPGGYFTYNNEIIKMFDAMYETGAVSAAPGTVIDDKLSIACNPGILRPSVLQRPGKKRMTAEELLRGFSIPIGTKLT